MPRRFQRKIRSTEFDIIWYLSTGEDRISCPHPVAGLAAPGCIYVHRASGSVPQMWMMDRENVWQRVFVGDVHPRLPTHCLTLLSNGDPSWVTKKTVTTYRGRAKVRILYSSLPLYTAEFLTACQERRCVIDDRSVGRVSCVCSGVCHLNPFTRALYFCGL